MLRRMGSSTRPDDEDAPVRLAEDRLSLVQRYMMDTDEAVVWELRTAELRARREVEERQAAKVAADEQRARLEAEQRARLEAAQQAAARAAAERNGRPRVASEPAVQSPAAAAKHEARVRKEFAKLEARAAKEAERRAATAEKREARERKALAKAAAKREARERKALAKAGPGEAPPEGSLTSGQTRRLPV